MPLEDTYKLLFHKYLYVLLITKCLIISTKFLRIIFLSVDNIFNNRYFEYKFLHVVFVSIFFSLCFFAFLPKNANQYYKKRKSLHLEWINCYFNFERNRIVL